MKAIVDTRNKTGMISKHVYGHFSEHLGRCIYNGYWVGEDSDIPNENGIRSDVIKAMKDISVPNIRWPGGCFADDYHWMDGIGPKEERTPIVNVHWGGVLESNHFGTHEFMNLCERIGCEPYICGNVGSGTVREMRDWVEYLSDDRKSPMAELRRKNGRDKPWNIEFFGIGNENWGCGGNMTAEQYAECFRLYATYVRNYKNMGKKNWWQSPQLMKIAGGENVEKTEWTKTLMSNYKTRRLMGGLSVHCYVNPGDESNGTEFSNDSWYQTARNTYDKEQSFLKNISIMDYYDPERSVAMVVDEWGIWVDNEPGTNSGFLYQQNTMRSAMCAALMLHFFNKHADRIRLCNLAQTINVLQSILLTEGPSMIKTPTYYVFDLLKGHQDACHIPVLWDEKPATINHGLPNIDMSVSTKNENETYITVVNLSAEEHTSVEVNFAREEPLKTRGRLIHGAVTAHNTFETPDTVKDMELDVKIVSKNDISFSLPPSAIAAINVKFSNE